MKKSILKRVGIAFIVVSTLLLGACNPPEIERGSYIDTYTLDAVDIKAKAYPGFNYISWGVPLTCETRFEIIRDDGKWIADDDDENWYIDEDIMDDVTYTYTLYTRPYGSDGQDIVNYADPEEPSQYSTYYVVKGSSKAVSVKAIKPEYIDDKGEFVNALDLVKYEANGNKKYVISKDNLRFKVNGSTIRVAFPTKAYLQYSMNVYRGNAYDLYGVSKMPDSDRTTLTDSLDINQNFYKMDSVYSTSFPALSAGSYQVVIKVDGFGCYETSYIVSDPITIEALDVKEGTRIESAGYMDDGKTIRISWRPAVDSNYKEWPVDNYKVYLKDSNHIYTDSNVTVKADNKYGNTIYYAEYTVPDNDVEYDFYVLLSDGDKVEDNSGKDDEGNDKSISRKVGPYGGLDWARRGWAWADFTDMEDQDINNDALLVITVPDNKVTVGSVKYKIIGPKTNTDEGWNKYTDTNLYNDSELKEPVVVPVDYLQYLVKVPNVALGSKVLFIYTFKEDGKRDSVERITTGHWVDENDDGDTEDPEDWYEETCASVKTVEIYDGEFDFNFTNSNGYANKGKFTIVACDGLEDNYPNYNNYKYEIYYARLIGSCSVKDIENVTTAWTPVTVGPIAWSEDDMQWRWESSTDVQFAVDTPVYDEYLKAEDGKPVIDSYDAQYVFKFVKTNKNAPAGAEGSVAVAFSDVQYMTKAKN